MRFAGCSSQRPTGTSSAVLTSSDFGYDHGSHRRGGLCRVALLGLQIMLGRPSADSAVPWIPTGLLVILNIAGFAFTLAAFYPGVITVDALAVYRDLEHGFVGDWQSP